MAIAATLASGYGHAQDTDEGTDARVDEVIVTGQKIERSLQDTAASVAVYDVETIDNQNFITLGDILNQTANVSSLFNDGVITIRGVRNIGASGEVTSDVSTVYVDGVFLPRSLFASGGLNLWDIQSAEIFRGPQSTVQGRNALAGAVVLNTVDPSYEFEGSAQALFAEFGTWRASGAVSIPIVEDQFALRLAVDEYQSDGWIDNPTLGIDDSAAEANTTIRAKALWEPAALPDLSVRLNYTNIDAFEGDGRVEFSEFPQRRVTFENVQGRLETDAQIASLKVDYALGDVWTVTSVTSYTDNATPSFTDPTRDETGGDSANDFVRNDDIFSQELRFGFETDRARGVFGAYYFKQEGDQEQSSSTLVGTDFAFPDPTTLAGLVFMTPTPSAIEIAQATAIRQQIVAAIPEFTVGFERNADIEIENFALFGEFDYDFSDRWTLTAGLRYDSEDIAQNVFDETIAPALAIGDPLIDQVLAGVSAQFSNAVAITDVDNDFDAWLPKLAVTYNWTDSVSTSFTYQRGYRAGGLSINIFRAALAPQGASQDDLQAAGIVNSFDPEFTNNYEFALRSQFMDGRATLNANLFYIDYTDQQVNVQLSQNPLDTLTENVGESELFGFEVEYSLLVADGFEIGGNLGYVSTEFTEGGGILDNVIGGGLDLTGLEFSYAPQVTAGAYGRYEWESGWFVNGRIRYEDESFSQFDNNPLAVNDNYTLVDLIGGYQTDRWRGEIFINNALDEDYFTANFGPAPNAINIAGAPRTIGGRFVVSF
ncbi:MAG: TonB-dependent receptor [Pseudomonadota bacterium]